MEAYPNQLDLLGHDDGNQFCVWGSHGWSICVGGDERSGITSPVCGTDLGRASDGYRVLRLHRPIRSALVPAQCEAVVAFAHGPPQRHACGRYDRDTASPNGFCGA